MRQVFLMAFFCVFAGIAMAQTSLRKQGVEVLYFHGKQRCVTCMAIEKHSREVVYQDFAKDLKAGRLRFRVVAISTVEGARLAKAYKVSWASLYVNRWAGGKETQNDLTKMGFQYARNKTTLFKAQLREKISTLLQGQ